jgi:hypothetical protein
MKRRRKGKKGKALVDYRRCEQVKTGNGRKRS